MVRRLKSWPLWLLVVVVLAGCSYRREVVKGPPMPLDNSYVNPRYDHTSITSVLLLPLYNKHELTDFEFHRGQLTSAVVRNFGKFGYFNLHHDPKYYNVAGQVIDYDSGLIDRVKLGEVGQSYNVQAVMTVTVEEFRPYPPMRIKVKATMFDANTGERVWAFDHVYDSDDADVVNSMRMWWNTRIAGGDIKNHFEPGRVRPTVFSNFVFFTMARSYGYNRMLAQDVVEEEEKAALKALKKQ